MRNRLSGFRSLAITLSLLAAACASPGGHGASRQSAADLASRVKAGDSSALANLRAGAEAGDAGGYGVVDEIAARVIGNGGRVLSVRQADIPGGRPLAAILRYPM